MVVALGLPSKSFEEVRVDDYLLSFQSSGRPPLPVLQEPTDEIQRKALGLPPLFKPQTELSLEHRPPGTSSSSLESNVASSSVLSSLSQNTTTREKIVNAAGIPLGQEFRLHSIAGEKYHNITCMPEYEGFSTEELRFHAYFRGNITSPIPVKMDPFTTPAGQPSTSLAPEITTDADDRFQSQCALPEYNRHSPEELRVAWMMNGREMTSTDLLGPPLATPTLPAPPLATPLATIPLPVIAAATPPAPKFNFVFK